MELQRQRLVGLDVGTSKVTAIVGQMVADGEVEIMGLGVVGAEGFRRGAVIDQVATVESIRQAVAEAESTAGIEIDHARVSLSGTHIKGFNSRVDVALAEHHGQAVDDSVRLGVNVPHAVDLPDGRHFLHVLPQAVDQEDRKGDPIAMSGSRLAPIFAEPNSPQDDPREATSSRRRRGSARRRPRQILYQMTVRVAVRHS